MKKLLFITLLIAAITGCKQQKIKIILITDNTCLHTGNKGTLDTGWYVLHNDFIVKGEKKDTIVYSDDRSDCSDMGEFIGDDLLIRTGSIPPSRYADTLAKAMHLDSIWQTNSIIYMIYSDQEALQIATHDDFTRRSINLFPNYGIHFLDGLNGKRYSYHAYAGWYNECGI